MANKLKNRLDDLKSSFERLSPREQRLLGALVGAFFLTIVFVVGFIIQSGLDELEEHNSTLRQALADLERHKAAFLIQRRRIAAIEVRMSHTPLELNRLVETAASAVGVNIAESNLITSVVGERYTQRGVEIKLRKITIDQLARLMKELEGSPQHIVQITNLHVNTRWNQHEDLDVEMVVSTFERNPKDKPAGDKKRRRTKERS